MVYAACEGKDETLVSAAYLHDIIEDCAAAAHHRAQVAHRHLTRRRVEAIVLLNGTQCHNDGLVDAVGEDEIARRIDKLHEQSWRHQLASDCNLGCNRFQSIEGQCKWLRGLDNEGVALHLRKCEEKGHSVSCA